jgi:hypothetical protein
MNISNLREHMSKSQPKRSSFPPLQRRIILCLAKNDAQTINETKEGLKGHYKSTWIAFNVLQQKGLIKKTNAKIYRNREYPLFWLTQGGIFVALVEGADAGNLLQRAVNVFPDEKTLQCCLELSPLLGLEGFKIGLSAIQDKGKLDYSDMMKILLAYAQKDMSMQQFKGIIETLKKYPKEHEATRKRISQTSKLLAELESMI